MSGGFFFNRKDAKVDPRPMQVPCGSCLGCRLDRAQQWATRIIHEAQLHEHNSFCTFTYRDAAVCTDEQYDNGLYLPPDGSLQPKHFRNFLKKLRHRYPGRPIRYYQCGEYGDQLNRPHHHATFFNLRFHDEELFDENDGQPLFTSEFLENLWGYGFCTVSPLTWENAAYISRYALKKITGEKSHEHYLRFDDYGNQYWLHPEYSTMSRRPGLGTEWLKRYHNDVYPNDRVPVPTRDGHTKLINKAPKFYDQLLEDVDPDQLESVKRTRQRFRDLHRDEYTPERLKAKYKVKRAQLTTRRTL